VNRDPETIPVKNARTLAEEALTAGCVIGWTTGEDNGGSPFLTLEFGKKHEFHAYDGAGHAFQNHTDERYRPAASEDAWRRYLAFFRETL